MAKGDVCVVISYGKIVCFSFFECYDISSVLLAIMSKSLAFSCDRRAIPLPNFDVFASGWGVFIGMSHLGHLEFHPSQLLGVGILAFLCLFVLSFSRAMMHWNVVSSCCVRLVLAFTIMAAVDNGFACWL